MENLDKGNRKIVLFSGGFDSTLVLARLVKEADEGSTVYAVTIDHNLTGVEKLRREYESQILILRELRKQFPKVKINHEVIHVASEWISGEAYNSLGLSQPILWVCNLIPLLEEKDTIYFGYNHDDAAILFEEDINNFVKAACRIQEDKTIYTHYPIKHYSKTMVLKTLIQEFSYLVEFCISCESTFYEGEKVCGNCEPCKNLKQALLNLTLDSEVEEWATRLLKQLFGLIVAITYDTEEEARCETEEVYEDTHRKDEE